MIQKIYCFSLLLALYLYLFPLFSFFKVEATILINEFAPAATTPWVEFLNTDENSSQDLTNWTLQNGSGTTLKALSGTLPRQGFLTFEFSSGILQAGGDCILLANTYDVTVHAVSYANGDCPEDGEPHLTDNPGANQSAALINNSLALDDTPSRGWCNDNTGGCPTISQIVSAMNANGVSSNLSSQSDYSRISGLYFQKSETTDPNGTPLGKIEFLSEMNFTDRDALSWMQQMDSNISMSTRGTIGLNAELIKNLTATNARLTMYGLNFNNPTIQVTNTNGSSGDSSIVSGLSYSGGNLTFTAAHFTTFTAVERSSSSSSSSAGPPSCSSMTPAYSPHLFQIDTGETSAKLYFTPVNDNISYYYIAYGPQANQEQYGVQFDQGRYEGVIDFTINLLSPNTAYYFKVRAGNGCAPGPWSNTLKTVTDGQTPLASVNLKEQEITEASREIPASKSAEKITVEKQNSINQLNFWQKIIAFFLQFFKNGK